MGLRYKIIQGCHWLGETPHLQRYQRQQVGAFIEDELSPEIKPMGWKEDIKSNLTFMWISEICMFTDIPSVWKDSWEARRNSAHLEKKMAGTWNRCVG